MYELAVGQVVYFVQYYHEEEESYGPFSCIRTVDLYEVIDTYMLDNPTEGRHPKGFNGRTFVDFLVAAKIIVPQEEDRLHISVGNSYNPPHWYYELGGKK